MRFRTLGRTGLRVSEISLGTVEIGLDYGIARNGQAERPTEAEAAAILHRALDLGVNFIDTARAYGDSEGIIGRALKSRRKEFVLCSKALSHAGETFNTLRNRVTESVTTSLRLLGAETIDIMMVHSAPLEVIVRGEMAAILEDLRAEGKFRWIGASVYGEDAALAAIHSGKYDCLQVAYNALDRSVERVGLAGAEGGGIGVVARSVLLKGALTSRYQYLPDSLAPLKAAASGLNVLAAGSGLSLPELAYRFVLSRPVPHTALVGASTLHELESAVRFAESGPLPEELIEQIRDIAVEQQEVLNPATWGMG
jgi:aryl-alcohol dehydrogenase-like predicted oxidoreductase